MTSDNTPLHSRSLFAERMSELMQASDHSYRTLASAVSADAGYLNKISTGARPAPGRSLAAALDRELKADGDLVDLARAVAVPAQPARAQPLGDTDAEQARSTLRHLVALDTLQGSDGLTPIAVRAFRAAADRLSVVGGTADVRSAVADLGAAAAWIASDDVQRDLSRQIALEALALADLAGDTRMHRFLLSHLSMVSEHAGRYGDALAYAEQLRAEQPDSPRVLAMIQVRRARALSGLGAQDDALAAWDHARNLLTESPADDDGLTYWIHDSELAVHRAVILTRGGDREAVEWAHRGVEWLPAAQGRDQVLFRAMRLYDAVAAHAWREVPGLVDDLIQYAGHARSARVPEEIERALALITKARAPRAVHDAIRAARTAFSA